MVTRRASLLALTILGLASLVLDLSGPARAQSELPCRVSHERRVTPLEREIGQQVTVSLDFQLDCNPRQRPMDLVLVIDASPGISRASLDRLKVALERAIIRSEPRPDGDLRIAIMAYDDRGLIEGDNQLSDDPESILRALRRIEPSARDCLGLPSSCGASGALRRAAELIDSSARPDGRRVVLLASAGIGPRVADPDYDGAQPCNELSQAAGMIRSRADGSVLVTACASDETGFCKRRCLSNRSSDDDRFAFLSETPSWSPLELGLPDLVEGRGEFHPVDRVEIVDLLPEALVYEGGDAPGAIDDQQLSWTGYPLTRTWGLSLTYILGLRNCGRIPSSEDAFYRLSYMGPMWGGIIQSDSLASPVIDVRCDLPETATPTPTRASPSPSATATAATASPSPSASPTTALARIYLPHVAGMDCVEARPDIARDWVLAIDVSGTMAGPAGPPFGSDDRWTAARELAGALIGSMDSDRERERDRLALLQFGEAGEIRVSDGGLQPCCQAALTALNGLAKMRNGHPWAALEVARDLLERAPPSGGSRRPGILFLTDLRSGDLGPSEDALMLERAGRARAAGIAIHVVSMGEAGDRAFATRWTGDPARSLDSGRLWRPLTESAGGWLRCTH